MILVFFSCFLCFKEGEREGEGKGEGERREKGKVRVSQKHLALINGKERGKGA